MLRTSDIIVDQSILGNDEIRCTRVSEDYEYVNGKRTEKLQGYKYDCVIIELGYEPFQVKIPGNAQMESPTSKKGVPVTFEGLILGITVSAKGDFASVKLKGTAKSIHPIIANDGKKAQDTINIKPAV